LLALKEKNEKNDKNKEHLSETHILYFFSFCLQLLKMVFSNLEGYKEDTSSPTTHPILACRQVNKYWKYVAEKQLESATISALEIELRGRSKSEQNRVETIASLIPTLYTAPKSSQIDFALLKKIWCHNFLKEMDSNPFPFKSLQIVGVDRDWIFPTSHFSKMPVLKLLTGWDLGHNITSFILCKGFQISPWVLQLLLEKMPSLKVLQIVDGYVIVDNGDVDLEENQFKLPPLNQLTVLTFFQNNVLVGPHGLFHSHGATTWVLNSYVGSQTLKQLEIDDISKLCLSLKNFPSLKCLKLWCLNDEIFPTSETLQLEQLSINHVHAYSNISFEGFTDFLEKFSSTLAHLEINSVPIYHLNTEGFNFGKRVTSTFPNLKFFSWDYPRGQEAMRALAFYFLPRFPALEKLELTQFLFRTEEGNSGENDDAPLSQKVINEITAFWKRENYWGICKNLKSIHVFRRSEPHNAIYVGYRERKA